MKYGDLSLGQIEAIVNKLGGLDRAKAFLRGEFEPCSLMPEPLVFRVRVSYVLTIQEMVNEGGFDWNQASFPTSASSVKSPTVAERDLYLFRFDEDMRAQDVVLGMSLVGYEPATIEDTLAFAAMYPDEQCKYKIISLGGSPERSIRGIALYLSSGNRDRLIYTHELNDVPEYKNSRYLARKKYTSK